jgi:ABC-type transporter Mla subunit MlaD
MSEETRSDPLADVINMLAAPIAGGIRSFEQFRRGVEELFRAVDNVNRTMENLNEAATRINALLAEIEEPVRAIMPQVTRTVRAADEITTLMEGPVRATAPRIERIVETLGSPGFTTLPTQIGELMQRLGPLAQLAENAGGLFGAFRMPGMPKPAASSAATTTPAPTARTRERSADHPAVRAVAEVGRASTKKAATKKAGTKRAAAKKPATTSTARRRPPKGATPAN